MFDGVDFVLGEFFDIGQVVVLCVYQCVEFGVGVMCFFGCGDCFLSVVGEFVVEVDQSVECVICYCFVCLKCWKVEFGVEGV